MLSFLKNIQVLYRVRESYQNKNTRAIFKAITGVLETLEDDVKQITLEGSILTARGSWLDEWGNWLGLTRFTRETDDALRIRILNKLKYSSTTVDAIKVNSANFYNSKVDNEYNYDVEDWTVIENWRDINILSVRGSLSSNFRFPDGAEYNWCTIQVISPVEISKEYIELVDSIKAAGIVVYYMMQLVPKSFLRVIDYMYQAGSMKMGLRSVGELSGYYNSILSYSGYYGNSNSITLPTYSLDKAVELIVTFLELPSTVDRNNLSEVKSYLSETTDETYSGVRAYRRLMEVIDKYTNDLPEDSSTYPSGSITKGIMYHFWSSLGFKLAGITKYVNWCQIDKLKFDTLVKQPRVYLAITPPKTDIKWWAYLQQSGGLLVDYFGNYVITLQDWYSPLDTMNDAINFYGEVPLLDLQFKQAMCKKNYHSCEIWSVDSSENKIVRL